MFLFEAKKTQRDGMSRRENGEEFPGQDTDPSPQKILQDLQQAQTKTIRAVKFVLLRQILV